VLALLRFHWAAGARVALRANAVVLGIIVFVFGSAPDGLATLRGFVLGVVARGHGGASRGVFAAVAFAFAGTAAPRVLLGASGWMRSLPVDARASWRAAVAALCAAQLAVVTFIPISVIAAIVVYHAAVSPAKIAALPVMIAAVAAAALPTRRRHTRLIAAAGVLLSVVGTWAALVAAIMCLAVADAKGPEIVGPRRRTRARKLSAMRGSALEIWIRAAWRAMRPQGIAATAALPAVVASFAFFITGNNPGLAPSTAATVVRVCGVISLALFAGALANALLAMRQPWPWARSLPWSARSRVLGDACALGIPLCALPLALSLVNATQAVVVASLVPLAAASGAAAVRGAGGRQTGAAGECMVIVLVMGGAIAIWPMLSLVALAATPLFVWLGVRRDRASVATRWIELHHDAAGDPGWLSRP
jgi:hypothetical protein